MTNHEILHEAVKRYGAIPQMDMAQEECAELIQALNKIKRLSNYKPPAYPDAKKHDEKYIMAYHNLCGEIADVEIMIYQLKIMFSREIVDLAYERKLARLHDRMNQAIKPLSIYLSGKITGLSREEYTHNFKQAEQSLAAYGYKIVNPVELPDEHDKSWKAYMRVDLKALRDCTHLYALDNWQDSRGARIEVWFAKRYNKTIIYQ